MRVIVDLPLGVQVRLDIAAGRRSRGTGNVRAVVDRGPCRVLVPGVLVGAAIGFLAEGVMTTGVGKGRSMTEQPRSVSWEIEELVIQTVVQWRSELAITAVPVAVCVGIARLLGSLCVNLQ